MKLKLICIILLLVGVGNLNAQWSNEQRLIASNNAEGDFFGDAVAVSGNYAVIGSKSNDENGTGSGAAYIYEKAIDGTWNEMQILSPSDADEYHRFGESVAINGNIAIIGAPGNTAVYVFEKSVDGSWTELQKLIASDAPRGNTFGNSIAISNNTIVVGASRDNGSTGAAYIFEKSIDGTWAEVVKVVPEDAIYGYGFGISVSVSNDRAIIGAFSDDERGRDSGSAYIFEKNANTWIQTQKLFASNSSRYNRFGNSVAISLNVAIVGAVNDVYIFEKEAVTDWTEVDKLHDYRNGQLGNAVAVSGNVAIVGALLDDEESPESGSAYMLRKSANGLWDNIQKINASNAAVGDKFGGAVAISGDDALIGSSFKNINGQNSGAAYFYNYTPTTNQKPQQTAYGTLNVAENSDDFLRDINATDDTDTEGNGLRYTFTTKYGYGFDNALFNLTEDTGIFSFINSPDFENPLDGNKDNQYEIQVTVTDSGGFYAYRNYTVQVTDVNETIWGNVQRVSANDYLSGSWFGNSVAISNDFAIIGANGHDDFGIESGAAYLYEKDTYGNWLEAQKLTASDSNTYDYFGSAVAISGNTAVVGAIGNDDNGDSSGSAYVYERNANGIWLESQKLLVDNGATNSNFGTSVGISQNYIVVGTHHTDANLIDKAYVFEKGVDGNWVQLQVFTASDAALGDDFGGSVSISEDQIVIGAARNGSNGNNSGAAYIFEKGTNGYFSETQKIVPSDASFSDRFGSSVAISTNTIIVGTPGNNDDGDGSGSAYIFEKNTDGNWEEQEKLTASDAASNNWFGQSVSISGNRVVVGSDENGVGRGSAYLFEKDTNGTWLEIQILDSRPNAGYDSFGGSVSISGDVAVVGARNDDEYGAHTGAAYFFGGTLSNQAPRLEANTTVTIIENITAIVLDINASHYKDTEGNGLVYNLSTFNNGGIDNDLFTLVADTGELSFIAPPDYSEPLDNDADNTYNVQVTVTDNAGLTATQEIEISVTPSNRAPVLSSTDSFDFDVNGTNASFKVTATDDNDSEGNGLVYSFTMDDNSGADNSFFNLNDQNGEFSFITIPDIDNPLDNDGNNVYNAQVTVTDSEGLFAVQNVTITVIDITVCTNNQSISPSDAMIRDYFGGSVAISGNTAIVGANGNSAAYVFEKDANNNWVEIQKLEASDSSPYNDFGISVAISGNIAIIGSSNAGDNGTGSGAAYIFKKDANGLWVEIQKLLPNNDESYYRFGFSVAISGEVAIIGATGDNEKGLSSGSAYIFEMEFNGSWIETAKLTAFDGGTLDMFGYAVSVSGNKAIVGKYSENENNAANGAAYIFEKDVDGIWMHTKKLTPGDNARVDYFGRSVSIFDNVAIVGTNNSYLNDGNGSAYIFEKSPTGNWNEIQKLTASNGNRYDYFGYSVAVFGDVVMVGTNDVYGLAKNSAYIFQKEADGIWKESYNLVAEGNTGEDWFGSSVAISGSAAIGGADSQDNAQIFTCISIPDTEKPIIVLKGDDPIEINEGDTYFEPGYSATDLVDGSLTDNVIVGMQNVNLGLAGTYEITYNVADESGNAADEVSRTINVIAVPMDTIKPIIVLNGDNPLVLYVGEPFVEDGYLATDDVDGDITDLVMVDMTYLNMNVAGTYSITHNVKDSAENAAIEVVRTVIISELISTPVDLASNDISILLYSPTCPGTSNGSITITNDSEYDLIATLSGNGINEIAIDVPQKSSYVFPNLPSGQFVVNFEGSDVEINAPEFNVIIPELEAIGITNKKIDQGAALGHVNVTGSKSYQVKTDTEILVFEFSNTGLNSIELPLKSGQNTFEIKGTSDCQGIEMVTFQFNELRLFPNPVTDWISVSGFNAEGVVTILITDVSGKVVMQTTQYIENSTLRINVSDILNSGVYVLRLSENEKDRVEFKIVIK
ncbi:immunoglobulin-like domain-containing protein [Maribacter aquivivus]|uniref:immunoglobulin-like domain-containing protein n=1 Tax=Maribacter aquivivus TaxID=228958 RepID=UPI00248FD96C|nr:immunoglobulin-like domain-containing protein [Maribacter aquivivus]